MEKKKTANPPRRKFDYAAIIREFEKFWYPKSLKSFCEEYDYPYSSVLNYYRKAFWNEKAGTKKEVQVTDILSPVPLEIDEPKAESQGQTPPQPVVTQVAESNTAAVPTSPSYEIVNMLITFNNGMQISLGETKVDELFSLLRKIVG